MTARARATEVRRQLPEAVVRADGDRRWRVTASTDRVADDGLRIPLAAWRLESFRTNPILTWTHSPADPPIGTVPDIDVRRGVLDGVIQFAERGSYDLADTIASLWAQGVLRAVSVAGPILEWGPDETGPGGELVGVPAAVELHQVAVVQRGADPAALAVARSLNLSDESIDRFFVSTPTATTPNLCPPADQPRLRAVDERWLQLTERSRKR